MVLHERFAESLLLLSTTLALPLGSFPSVFTYNADATAGSLTNLSAAAERRLRAALRPDYVLWRAARARFDELWRRAHLHAHRSLHGDAADADTDATEQPFSSSPPPPSPPRTAPFRCDWARARCWDSAKTTSLKARSTLDGPEALGGGGGSAPQQQQQQQQPVATWPVAAVKTSPLWRLPNRRQRVKCAAECNATSGGLGGLARQASQEAVVPAWGWACQQV